MQDRSDRHPNQATATQTAPRRLGSYFVEAGLLTLDQINVILNDQQATGMRFGDIAVARGWLKEQTIEWIVEKVIEPERQASNVRQSHPAAKPHPSSQSPLKHPSDTLATDRQPTVPPGAAIPAARSPKTLPRREGPIAKPLPSVNAADNGVYWVG